MEGGWCGDTEDSPEGWAKALWCLTERPARTMTVHTSEAFSLASMTEPRGPSRYLLAALLYW